MRLYRLWLCYAQSKLLLPRHNAFFESSKSEKSNNNECQNKYTKPHNLLASVKENGEK